MAPKQSEKERADAQHRAAAEAAELLAERLGDELPRFVDLFEAASFRFRGALTRRLESLPRPASTPPDA